MHILILALFIYYKRQLCVCWYKSVVYVKYDDKPKKPSKIIKKVKSIKDRYSNE